MEFLSSSFLCHKRLCPIRLPFKASFLHYVLPKRCRKLVTVRDDYKVYKLAGRLQNWAQKFSMLFLFFLKQYHSNSWFDWTQSNYIQCASAFLWRMQSLANYSRKSMLKQSGHQRRKPGLEKTINFSSCSRHEAIPFYFRNFKLWAAQRCRGEINKLRRKEGRKKSAY